MDKELEEKIDDLRHEVLEETGFNLMCMQTKTEAGAAFVSAFVLYFFMDWRTVTGIILFFLVFLVVFHCYTRLIKKTILDTLDEEIEKLKTAEKGINSKFEEKLRDMINKKNK